MNGALLNHYRELLTLVDGNAHTILDVGCGSNEVLKLALCELPTLELAVGVERNHRRTQQAPPLPVYMRRPPPLPVYMLADGERVLTVHGRDGDWDTVVFSSLDEQRGRRILRGFCDMGPSGSMGRNVPGFMRQAGFANVECRVSVILEQEYRAGTHGHFTADVIRQFLEASKLVPRSEVDAWTSELEELSRAGRYLFSANRYVCVGRV